ncbi:hypothetical protein A4D02_24830 [Niastella koreensis]|uniref:Secretion system C-terminal sorting domain-containing protein n=2 Tax=Niastella koreensis TaxID=354356 RepID=G8TFV9_NIAKG|nr:T9SS type A sorting domain-containing protein [Niastella koreensis]AEW00558.1 hypothetical protein Niako_4289 [Niastella koreensis GR20-10]OQP52416.1 hypothetical protein A4D02_24830 [Niastella koreensis]
MIAVNLLLRAGLFSILLIPFNDGNRQHNPFTSFDIELNGRGGVSIRWSTVNRFKNVYFEIERSREQRLWTTISVVNSGSQFPYSFIDAHPEKGINFYRVKEIDTNALGLFSPVKEIYVNKPGVLSVWPNPVNDVLHIRTSFTNGSFDLIDVSGRVLQKYTVTAFTTDVPVGSLPGGIYFVRIRYDTNKEAVEKFIKN